MPTIRRTAVFATWLDGLRDVNAVARIVKRIDRLSLGNPGDVRNLTGGISEMRIDYGPGYRVYYTQRGAEIVVLLCGGDKRSQQADIAAALTMAKEL